MKLLGPVFWRELREIARRQRLALARSLFASLLLIALFLVYSSKFHQPGLFHNQFVPTARLKEMAWFATYVFGAFAALQFAVVVLLTPALTANALAEDRSRNTLPFLLTTQLSSREIVLWKLFTRLMQVGMIVLTGIPVLGILQLFGGVDQLLIVAAFVATAVTAFSLGSLGMACAVFVKKPQRAAWRAYQWIVAYALLSALFAWMYELPVASRFVWRTSSVYWPPVGSGAFTFRGSLTINASLMTVGEQAVDWFGWANPWYAVRRFTSELASNVELADCVLPVMRDYVLAHGLIGLVCLALAIRRLRSVSASQTAGLTYKKSIYQKPAPHPPIKDRPVLWKEWYCESKPRQRWFAMLFSKWFFFVSFFPAWAFIVLSLESMSWGQAHEWMTVALSVGGTLVAGGLLLRIGMQAARSIGSERDRQTLDSLLATELTPDEIVRDKWWGCLLSGRWVMLWLLIHWLLGILAMALRYEALPLLCAEVFVFGAFMASLGLYCSVRYPTTKKAVTVTLLVGVLGTTVIPWLLVGLLELLLLDKPMGLREQRDPYEGYRVGHEPPTWPQFVEISLTPVRMMFETSVPHDVYRTRYYQIRFRSGDDWWTRVVPAAIGGMFVYGLAAIWLRRAALARFRDSFGVKRRPSTAPAR